MKISITFFYKAAAAACMEMQGRGYLLLKLTNYRRRLEEEAILHPLQEVLLQTSMNADETTHAISYTTLQPLQANHRK